MIGWIALILAADAESKASSAKRRAGEALHTARGSLENAMVILRPVELETVPVKKVKGFWKNLFIANKQVLAKEPWTQVSIKRSDIQSLRQYKDWDKRPFVTVEISRYAGITNWCDEPVTELEIPGTIEEVTAVLNGVKVKRKKR